MEYFTDDPAGFQQIQIALFMSVLIIDLLQAVCVHDKDRVFLRSFAHFQLKCFRKGFVGVPVADPGQRIPVGHSVELGQFFFLLQQVFHVFPHIVNHVFRRLCQGFHFVPRTDLRQFETHCFRISLAMTLFSHSANPFFQLPDRSDNIGIRPYNEGGSEQQGDNNDNNQDIQDIIRQLFTDTVHVKISTKRGNFFSP